MDGYSINNYWLKRNSDCEATADIEGVRETIENDIIESAACQPNARREGELQPLAVTRTETNKCSVTVMPGGEMYIGDIVEVFGESWICVELHTDEYGITYGEIWLCNHKLVYQNYEGEVITQDVVIEDGSYSKGNDKSLPSVDGTYKCYLPLNDKTNCLFVDKRLALGVAYDSNGKKILEVGKITWIDRISHNYGRGSHVLFMSLSRDVYNEEKDNLDILVCDYISENNSANVQNQPLTNTCLVINGKDSIRIGTNRTYKATVVGSDGNGKDAQDVEWEITADKGIVLKPNLNSCTISVPLWDALIGTDILITCRDKLGELSSANKKVAVISIG